MTELSSALDAKRVILCIGSGGVGKTTTAAALAVEAARRGRRTAVLTVDPAQRLKDALGLGALAGEPHRVPLGGVGLRGAHLDALLLDVKRTLDELVLGLAATPEQAQAVLENRLYQNLSTTLAGTAEYMAVEKVYRLAEEGGYESLVVDTPPSRHAVDFLDAPRRLLALLDSAAFAIMKDPTIILPGASSRIAHAVLAAVLRGLERFTGIGLVREIGDFVRAIESLTVGLRERVARVAALLRSESTALFLVTAPEPRLVGEGEALAKALGDIDIAVSGVIVNRALPRAIFGASLADPGDPEGVSPRLATRLRRGWSELRALAAREEATLGPLVARAQAAVVAEVPLLPTNPGSLADLLVVARHLFPDTAAPAPASGLGR